MPLGMEDKQTDNKLGPLRWSAAINTVNKCCVNHSAGGGAAFHGISSRDRYFRLTWPTTLAPWPIVEE
ncbi:hypothetical protein N7533_012928 [Penicillium manginii]|uniref:uncharacterized protein n=1 Tax=Penicillium manginii TaxID=203109 RepID=UPI0025490723|nr:uncharacterized protein N7533_013786 [Penicillium manginii]XP_056953163.1 uncharacterized protein N7533_012928 [Penicillium manginii]KAJ5733339.1 hypothetical protein N7533_013786 [Penicillium manginii]KAJ5734525.1 hypothetical protein N7533_012928 [Penicillium manginii]